MCGIAGTVTGSPVGNEGRRLRAVLHALRHRGPDESSIISRPGIHLGATRLAIMDLSPTGSQPTVGCGRGVIAALNGEVYNHAQLAVELRGAGHHLRGHSDTEVLAHAWEEWGPACLPRLRGMFAVAVHDADTGKVYLARDTLGEKPLYVHLEDGQLTFASEVRALKQVVGSPTLDDRSINAFAHFGSLRGASTIFSSIRSVAPGELLTFDIESQALLSSRYGTEIRLVHNGGGSRPAAAEVVQRVTDAVIESARSDVPAALCLSAGLDSAILASILTQANAVRSAYTLVFDDPSYSELEGATATAKAYDLPLTEVLVDQCDWIPAIQGFVAALDQPSVDGLNNYLIARAIAVKYKVAFSGVGADEAFGGYSTFRYLDLPQVPIWSPAGPHKLMTAASTRWPQIRMLRALRTCLDPQGLDSAYDELRRLHPILRNSLHRVAPLPRPWDAPVADEIGRPRKVAALELSRYLPDTLLRDMDAVSMSQGLEMRAPFLHPDIVQLGLTSLTSEDTRGAGKALLREAFRDALPDHVRKATRKQGFAVPVGAWLNSDEGRDYTHAMLGVDTWQSQGVFRPGSRDRLLSYLEQDLSKPENHALYLAVFGALILTMWLEANLA